MFWMRIGSHDGQEVKLDKILSQHVISSFISSSFLAHMSSMKEDKFTWVELCGVENEGCKA